MAIVKLLHNDKAGDEEHSPDNLIALVESAGYTCDYRSIKKSGWHRISDETDFVIIAGGDGTVRKVVKKLLERKLDQKKFPIAILPLGTANNLAKTLGVDTDIRLTVQSWKRNKKCFFDVGKIYGLDEQTFFLEGLGYGVFPHLMKRMKQGPVDNEASADEQLETALKMFYDIVNAYKPRYCRLDIDGVDYTGNYILVEVLNIRSIGPNLYLGPDVKVDDGELDVVLVGEEHRTELARYILNKIKGIEAPPKLKLIKARNLQVEWHGSDGHVDDKRLKIEKPVVVRIETQKSLLEFYC